MVSDACSSGKKTPPCGMDVGPRCQFFADLCIMRFLRATSCTLVIAAAALAVGCAVNSPDLYRRFQAEDPSVRIAAAVEAGRTKDPQAVSYLIDRLNDSEPDVRFFSYVALKNITGSTMDYHYYDSASKREHAIERWREWLSDKQAARFPTGQDQDDS